MGFLDGMLDGVKAAAGAAGGAAANVASMVGDAAATAANAAGAAAAGAAADIYASFGGAVDIEQEPTVRLDDGTYILPSPVVNEREDAEVGVLAEHYERLNRPGLVSRAGGAIAKIVPDEVKDAFGSAGDAISEAELLKDAMKIVGEGFGAIEKQAASATVSAEYVVNRINRGGQDEKISSVEEICLLRSYDVARVVSGERGGHLGLAFAEGAATGAPGFAGIPFNLVLSTFLFFRAVQSVAMFYGYDVRSNPDEMVIAGDVIMAAYGAGDNGANGSVAAGYVGKVMAIAEMETAKQVVGKGWAAMASRGGVTLLLTQMRALAHATAQKALTDAGQKGLEKSVFSSVFTQIGRRLTQSAIKGAVPVVGGVIGAFFDSGIMGRMLDFAELFYHKRFILEKELRVRALSEGETFFDAVAESENIDVESAVEEAESEILEQPDEQGGC